METGRFVRKAGLVLALAVILFATQGCTVAKAVGRYFQYRADDALEMVDVGFTFTTKPCIGLYWNSLDLLVAGYCNIDGYFVGFGGNQIGVTRCYANCYGLLMSLEKVGWGKFDKNDPSTLYVRVGGLLGIPSMAGGGTPDYTPACVHFFPHLGYVGLVWNARWSQILDFIVGFTTIDIAGDDGRKFGRWPWQKEPPPPDPAVWGQALHRAMTRGTGTNSSAVPPARQSTSPGAPRPAPRMLPKALLQPKAEEQP